MIVSTIGYFGETIFLFDLLPQVYKIWKMKEVKAISLTWIILDIIGLTCRIIYLSQMEVKAVWFGQIFQIGIFLVLFTLKVKYDKKHFSLAQERINNCQQTLDL